MKKRDITLRYMSRFGCIGPECEDHCCHTWRVDVDPNTRKRLLMMANTSPEDRKLFKRVLRRHVERDPKTKTERVRYIIKMKPDGFCPMLDAQGLCNIHKNYGEKYLPVVCTSFPRRMQRIEDRVELSGMMSCPEVVRQLLLHEDAIDVVDFDRDTFPRIRPSNPVRPEDSRPFMRQQQAARECMWRLTRRPGYTIEQRLFFMAYFAKRVSPIMTREVLKGDPEPVKREMEKLDNPVVLDEIQRRFNALEAPSTIVLLLIQELVRPGTKSKMRHNFRDLVEDTLNGYAGLAEILTPEGEPDGEAAGATEAEGEALKLNAALVERYWETYRDRRTRTLAIARERVDQYLTNYTFNFWFHRLPVESPDLMVHMLRMLTQMAVLKFLLYSNPELVAALDAFDPEAPDAEQAFIEQLDRSVVEVFYKTARFMDHGHILTSLEKSLDAIGIKSIAGAVFLIHF